MLKTIVPFLFLAFVTACSHGHSTSGVAEPCHCCQCESCDCQDCDCCDCEDCTCGHLGECEHCQSGECSHCHGKAHGKAAAQGRSCKICNEAEQRYRD